MMGHQASVAGQCGPGDFITYIFALLNLMNQVKTLSNVTGTIQRGTTAAESVFALIDAPPEVDNGTVTLDRARGGLAFEQVPDLGPGRRAAIRGGRERAGLHGEPPCGSPQYPQADAAVQTGAGFRPGLLSSLDTPAPGAQFRDRIFIHQPP